MQIRKDLVGTTHVHLPGGGVVVLLAGDTVPDGVEVGDHLIEKGEADGTGVKRGRGRTPRPTAES